MTVSNLCQEAVLYPAINRTLCETRTSADIVGRNANLLTAYIRAVLYPAKIGRKAVLLNQ